MTNEIKDLIENISEQILTAYDSSPTIPEAEKLAVYFLTAQLQLSTHLKSKDLDSRMRKSGLKSIKAAIYLETVRKNEKKPSDVQIDHIINLDEIVCKDQDRLDESEVDKSELERVYGVCKEAHIYFRNLSKAKFE